MRQRVFSIAVKGPLRRCAPLTEQPPARRDQAPVARQKKRLAFARGRGPKCASRENCSSTGESVFVHSAQTVDASRENAFAYDEWASGGLLGGINTYAYVEGNPISKIDPFGLTSEVVIWQPVGWGSSSFGHVSTNINGTTYSYGPDGMWTGPTSKYMEKNDFRSGVGTELNLTPEQEQQFEACMKKPQGNYNPVSNNCGAPAQYCLHNMGINLGGFTPLPVNLGNNLINGGIGRSYNFYPATTPSTGSSAPWAR